MIKARRGDEKLWQQQPLKRRRHSSDAWLSIALLRGGGEAYARLAITQNFGKFVALLPGLATIAYWHQSLLTNIGEQHHHHGVLRRCFAGGRRVIVPHKEQRY